MALLPLFFTNCDTGASPSGDSEDPPPVSSLYTPGTYMEKASGYGGAMTVSTVFSEDSITAIEIVSHKESSGREAIAAALEQIPQAIIADQTLTVDVITGATYTSNAIIKAVEKCVNLAGGEDAVSKLKGTE
jgi:fumarate reductase flavoprotein subunit